MKPIREFFKGLPALFVSFLDELWLILGFTVVPALFVASGKYGWAVASVLVWWLSSKWLKRTAKKGSLVKSFMTQLFFWVIQHAVAGFALVTVGGASWSMFVVLICLSAPALSVLQFFAWYNTRGKRLRLQSPIVEVEEQF
jgi:hypothetical protein